MVSCLDENHGGGLFALVEGRLEKIEAGSSTGLCVRGDRMARLLWSDDVPDTPSTLILHGRDGLTRFQLDQLREPHGVIWVGDEILAVSTARNEILWITTAGEVTRSWRASGEGDSWHLNSIMTFGNEIYISAFGAFQGHREWDQHRSDASGFIFNLRDGKHLISGLDCPHQLLMVDGAWVVCNSGREELLQVDLTGQRIMRRQKFRGWIRGLAVSDEHIFVGVSAHRLSSHPKGSASIAVLDRISWKVVETLSVPCAEIYDLVWVNEDLLQAIKSSSQSRC